MDSHNCEQFLSSTIHPRVNMLFKIIITLLCVDMTVWGFSRPSHITLDNNGYKNVVVAIHDSIPEDPAFIDNLKTKLTEASKILYNATLKRAYLKEVTILIPPSWTSSSNYGRTTTDTLQEADVIISNPLRAKRSLATASSYRGCGKQGIHVLLTEKFLRNSTSDALYAKYFVHAWAQFRWGVFQEYADEGESEFYFSLKWGRADSIRCTWRLMGMIAVHGSLTMCRGQQFIDSSTGLFKQQCEWRPYPTMQRVKASLMDHQWITALTMFCDDSTNYMTQHSTEPPNKQNILCGHRSTWNVITGTDDFKNNLNPSRDIPTDQLVPTFVNGLLIRTANHLEANKISHHVGLYVHVTQNMEAVLDVQVTAKISRPGAQPTYIELLDNGRGADQVCHDGIYSKFFTAFTGPGRYGVSFFLYNTSTSFGDSDSGRLLQIVRGGSFTYPGISRKRGRNKRNVEGLESDNMPPMRISDLHVVRLIPDNMTLILSWTAPGDDMDDGQASYYKLYTTSHWDGVQKIAMLDMTTKDIYVESIPVHELAGRTETIMWTVPEERRHTKGFAFGILAVDDAGNEADMSNVVTAGFVH